MLCLLCPECLSITPISELENKKDWFGYSGIDINIINKFLKDGDGQLPRPYGRGM